MSKWLIIPNYSKVEESVKIAAEYGAAFEYNDFFEPSVYMDEAETNRRIEKYLSLGRDTKEDTLHGAFFDVAIDSRDDKLRDYSRKLVRQSFDIAKKLGVKGVVLHTGLIAGLNTESYQNSWLSHAEEFYRQICEEYSPLYLYLENTTEQTPDMLVSIAKKMEDVPNFKLCLDYAHASITSTTIVAWVNALKPYVGHIHVNDNDLKADLHLVPGEGKIDFSVFSAIRKSDFTDVPALLEVKGITESRKAIAYVTELEKGSESIDAIQNEKNSKFSINGGEVYSNEILMDVLETTLDIAGTKDRTKLLNLILTKSMQLTNCDAGTLYVVKDNKLQFKIMRTLSMGVDKGGDGVEIDMPPVELKETNVCAFCAIKAKMIDIPDVYQNESFDFSGPRKYDSLTGYHTQSMLAIPLADSNNNVIGVMQLINAQNELGQIVPFRKNDQKLVEILAAQAAITLQQAFYIEEISNLLWSFTYALAESIDLFTPYNGNHTRMVADYAVMLANKINEKHAAGSEQDYFDEKRMKQLKMAALLHDIGKITLPNDVLNKASRLGNNESIVEGRLKGLIALTKIDYYEGRISEEVKEERLSNLENIKKLVFEVNNAGFLSDEIMAKLDEVLDLVYEGPEERIEYFTEQEKKQLRVRKGTLTDEERKIVESHVTATSKILSNVRFSSDFKDAPVFAGQHHELLNGKGYPMGLTAESIPLESRILTVSDICDALLATDRPYKKAKTIDETFKILYVMADKEMSLERRLVEYLEEALTEI